MESVEIDAWLETDSSMDCTVMGKLDSERELLVNPKLHHVLTSMTNGNRIGSVA